MADVVQTILPVGEMKTFRNIFQEPERFRTSEPMAIINYFADSTVVTAIGAGDSATLRLRTDLPEGFLYRFKDMFFNIRGADADDWLEEGRFSFFFQVDTPSLLVAELEYPIVRVHSFAALGGETVTYNFGGLVDGVTPYVPFSPPTWLIRGRAIGATTNPTITLRNVTASVGPWTTGFLIRYDVFPVEQGDNSGVYWSQPVKQI